MKSCMNENDSTTETELRPPFFGQVAEFSGRKKHGHPVIWALVGAVVLLLAVCAGWGIFRFTADPYRTLEAFPLSRYLDNAESVMGSRYRAEVVADADLGADLAIGRLMSFREKGGSSTMAVLIPPDVQGPIFSKGQAYVLELEIREGGLAYVHSYKKI